MHSLLVNSSTDAVDMLLQTIDHYLHIFLLPVIIIFGVIGNISNIYIFTRPALYRTCSIYFLAGAANGLLLLLFGTTSRWLGQSFDGLDATRYSLFFCRFRNYIMAIIYDLAPYFIACVTVDRFCSSSSNANIRRWSTRPKLAYAVVIIIVLVTVIAYSHVLVFYTIIDSECFPQAGLYTHFFPFFATIYYFIAIIIIIIFGLGTVYNVQIQNKRIQPMIVQANSVNRHRRRNDTHIFIMLLVHLACYTCFAMPYHFTLIFAAVKPEVITDVTFIYIQHIAIIALNFSQAIDCYVYTFTAALYRKEFMLLLRRIFRRHQVEAVNTLQMSMRQTPTVY